MKTLRTSAQFSKLSSALLLGLAAVMAPAATQAATAPDAGDYTGLPAGTDLALLYTYHVTGDDVYSRGNKVASNLGLKADIGIARFVHFTKLGDYLIDPQIVIPFGRQELGAPGSKTSGLGDIIFGGTLWTIADLAKGEHLGWSVFVTAPTGGDKNKGFSLSDNRWKLELAAGYINRIAPKVSIDIVPQVEFYQNDRTTGAKRDPMARVFGHLRYHLTSDTNLAFSYSHAWGAKETLNGVTTVSAKNDDTLYLTAQTFLDKKWRLQLQAAQDVNVENGPKTTSLGAQLLYIY